MGDRETGNKVKWSAVVLNPNIQYLEADSRSLNLCVAENGVSSGTRCETHEVSMESKQVGERGRIDSSHDEAIHTNCSDHRVYACAGADLHLFQELLDRINNLSSLDNVNPKDKSSAGWRVAHLYRLCVIVVDLFVQYISLLNGPCALKYLCWWLTRWPRTSGAMGNLRP